MRKKLILVVGKTATGKSTLVRALCDKHGLKQVVSYATRPIRVGETDGLDHIFIQKEDVEKYKEDMAAYTKIGEYEYFATYDIIDKATFYVIDPNGIETMKKTCSDRYDMVVVYISTDYEKRELRAFRRNDNKETFDKRVVAEEKQFAEFERNMQMDYLINNNGTFSGSVEQMESILKIEGIL